MGESPEIQEFSYESLNLGFIVNNSIMRCIASKSIPKPTDMSNKVKSMVSIRQVLAGARLLTMAIIASLICSTAMAAKDYYKWVDENGVTHYSARKPVNVETETISVSTGLPRDENGNPVQVEDNATANNAGASQTAAATPEDNKDPERCEAAQRNLRIISENARIRERQEDGTTRFLTQEEIEQRKNLAERAINESC